MKSKIIRKIIIVVIIFAIITSGVLYYSRYNIKHDDLQSSLLEFLLAGERDRASTRVKTIERYNAHNIIAFSGTMESNGKETHFLILFRKSIICNKYRIVETAVTDQNIDIKLSSNCGIYNYLFQIAPPNCDIYFYKSVDYSDLIAFVVTPVGFAAIALLVNKRNKDKSNSK